MKNNLKCSSTFVKYFSQFIVNSFVLMKPRENIYFYEWVGAVAVTFQRRIRCAKETKAGINFFCSSDG